MISCIITTYKRPIEVLKRAIDSVINQSYQDIELFVVNDYPDDIELSEKIKKLVLSYNFERMYYILMEYNSGACAARNRGINESNGEYIAFLDDDDEWLPNKLEEQIKYFTSDEIGLVYCDNFLIKNGKKRIRIRKNPISKIPELYVLLRKGNFLGGTSFPLLRKSALIKAGMFDENFKINQDWDVWIRMAEICEFRYCPKILLNNYHSKDSITINENKIEYRYNIVNKYFKYYEKDKSLLNEIYNIIATGYSYKGSYSVAFKIFMDAFKTKPFAFNNIKYFAKAILQVIYK